MQDHMEDSPAFEMEPGPHNGWTPKIYELTEEETREAERDAERERPGFTEVLEYRDPRSLTPFARNSKKHPRAQVVAIAASIVEFGFTRPVLILPDGTIIAGHGAVEGAIHAGKDFVPCRVLHMSRSQARAYVIADNRLAELGEWDKEMLAAEFEGLRDEDFDLSLTGFDFEAIEKIIADLDAPQEQGDAPESEKGDKASALLSLKFGKYEIEVSAEELEDLTARYEAHTDAYGSSHGFVARLLMGAASQSMELPQD